MLVTLLWVLPVLLPTLSVYLVTGFITFRKAEGKAANSELEGGLVGVPVLPNSVFPHIAFFPTTTIAIIRIHIEIAIVALITVILAIAKGNRCGADFANLEVNFVVPFLAAVVVEAQNEGVDGQIGESEVPNLAVDLNGLHITNRPNSWNPYRNH